MQDNTFMNLYPFLTGRNISEGVGIEFDKKFDDDPLIWKYFHQAGYSTAFYEDYKMGGLFHWLKKGFMAKPADHYSRPFSCAVEKTVASSWASDFCYLDKGVHQWVGDWTKSYVRAYAKTKIPTFGFVFTTLITHEYTNMLGQGDTYYYEFFKELARDSLLNNTVMIFYSDHGYRYGGLRATQLGQYEENLPMMNIVLPDWFKQKYPKETSNLRLNGANRLTSPFDMHRTLLDLCPGCLKKAKSAGFREYGRSLFDPINEDRTCLEAGIPNHFCGCKHTLDISNPASDKHLQIAAQAVVDKLNDITKTHRHCVRYKVKSITYGVKNVRHDIPPSQLDEYVVNVAVTPSTAEFSATVHIFKDGRSPAVQGISRVSLYGNTADCVSDFELRLYCTCDDKI